MHKRLIAVFLTGLILGLAGLSLASEVALQKPPSGPAGKSHVAHLYLFEKDPNNWAVVWGGAWGKMKYNLWGPKFAFVFNGHRLAPGSDYTLIYYPDPWPGNGLIYLGSGQADMCGDVHIKGAVNTGDLPAGYDANYGYGAKIWLALSSDVDCAAKQMIGWNPTQYLFEYNLITFDDTDS